MSRTLPRAVRALYFVLLQQACTFYTNCPPCEEGNQGGSGGSSGSAGTGGTGLGGMAPSGEWANVTSNLAEMDSECGNLGFVSAKADENLVIAGVALRGLWASVDGGENWEPFGVGDGSDEIVNRPTAMIYDPEVPERFWEVGIYNSGGIYVTNDNGETFTTRRRSWSEARASSTATPRSCARPTAAKPGTRSASSALSSNRFSRRTVPSTGRSNRAEGS